MTRLLVLAASACFLFTLAGCDDTFAPGRQPVPPAPSEVVLADFETSELVEPSAFDIVDQMTVRTDLSSRWDFVFAVSGGDTPEFRPRGLVLDRESTAGFQPMDVPFDELAEVPDAGYTTDAPVPIEEGLVLAASSREAPGPLGIGACRRFMKIEILELDPSDRTVTFRHLGNPNCDETDVTPGPGAEDEE